MKKLLLLNGPYTLQPNRSKFFELPQSNQGYGELKGVKEDQKNVKQKYSIELILSFERPNSIEN